MKTCAQAVRPIVLGVFAVMGWAGSAWSQTVEVTPPGSAVTASTHDGNTPANTVDNNLGTRWSGNGDGAWLQLNLGARHVVSDVRIAVYNGNARRNRFDLQVSNDNVTWANVFTDTQTGGTTTLEERFDFPPGTEATYLRYVGHMSDVGTFNSVTEVSVFGALVGSVTPTPTSGPSATPTPTATPTPGSTPVNVTPGGSGVTASTNDGNVPANTVDNSLSTRWSGCGDGAWIQYDLGSTITVTSVQMAWYQGNTRRTTFDVAVSASSTGPWTALATGQQSTGTTTALETYNITDGAGRYLRVTGHGNTLNAWNSIAEIEIFGIATGPTPPSPTATPTPTPTTPPRVTPTPTPTIAPGAFRHPGVLINRAQLDFVKAKIQAGAEPWTSGYNKARTSSSGSLSYTPHPRSIVECGSSSNPNNGCTDERGDAMAAYTHALLWYNTGNSQHAQKAIQIMNAWSGTITDHTNSNAPLQTGWSGSMWAPAADIIFHTGAGMSSTDVSRFKTMLRNVYVPELINGSCANGNWELIMTNALMGIGVVLDDRAIYDKAVLLWRGRVPAYIYQTTDGSQPLAPGHCSRPSWHGQTTFVDGIGQETCRDFGHMEWGITAAIHAAETARQQGLNLYGEQSKRLRDGLEFHAKYDLGASVPSWLCGGSISTANTPSWEIAYNHYNTRLGLSMPNTLGMVNRMRPTGSNYFMAWETMTHAAVGSVGLP